MAMFAMKAATAAASMECWNQNGSFQCFETGTQLFDNGCISPWVKTGSFEINQAARYTNGEGMVSLGSFASMDDCVQAAKD